MAPISMEKFTDALHLPAAHKPIIDKEKVTMVLVLVPVYALLLSLSFPSS
jgi:hypothetical protein